MVRSEENRDEFFRIKQLWALKNTYKHASAPEVEGAVRRINQQLDQRRRIRRLPVSGPHGGRRGAAFRGGTGRDRGR